MLYIFIYIYIYSVSHSVVSDSWRPRGLQLSRLLCPWNSPCKNTWEVAIPFSRDLPNPGIEPRPPALQADSLPSELPGKPKITPVVACMRICVYVYICVCVCIYIYKYLYILYVYIHIKQVMMEMLVKCYNFKQIGRNNLWEEWGRI